MSTAEQRPDVFLSVARALWGEVFQSLSAVAFRVSDPSTVSIIFFVQGDASDDDLDSISVVATEVMADLEPAISVETLVLNVRQGQPIEIGQANLVFLRKGALVAGH